MHEDAEGPILAQEEGLKDKPIVVAVVGPTASGKTDLALSLARALGGEVVSADMGQLYRRLDAGTAKPPAGSTQLVDVLDPAQPSDAGTYARLARPVVDAVLSRGRLPIVAGGTGLYLRALLEGLAPLPPRDQALRGRLEARGLSALRAELARRDPEAAARVDPKNLPRLVRALEVMELTGRPLSELWRRKPEPPYRVLYLALDRPREELRARATARAAAMFPAMVAEVGRLVPAELTGAEPAFRCLGYPEALACARGELSEADGLRKMTDATNAYARRQLTWFRRQTPARWLDPADGEREAVRLIRGTG